MPDILVFQAILFVCGTIGFVASLRFVLRFLELRHERSLRAPGDAVEARLDRIEATVDAIALEVERIAEANRFVAKLLAERTDTPRPTPRPERVITPH